LILAHAGNFELKTIALFDYADEPAAVNTAQDIILSYTPI